MIARDGADRGNRRADIADAGTEQGREMVAAMALDSADTSLMIMPWL